MASLSYGQHTPLCQMDYSTVSTQLIVPKIEYPQYDFDWIDYYQDPFHNTSTLLEQVPQQDNFFDHDQFSSQPLPYNQYNQLLPHMGYQDFEDLSSWDYTLDNTATFASSSHCDYMVVDEKPLNTLVNSFEQYYSNNMSTSDFDEVSRMIEWGLNNWGKHEEESGRSTRSSGNKKIKKTAALELDEIQKYFDLPISHAAKELKVGLTVLKKRCRELNIMRWPHRKIKSLKTLIENVKGMGMTNEIMMLEEHKRLLQQLPDMELTERTKKLRQACFKANYKKKRSLTITAGRA